VPLSQIDGRGAT